MNALCRQRAAFALEGNTMVPRFLVVLALGCVCALGLCASHAVTAADLSAPSPTPGGSAATTLSSGNPIVARVDGVELHLSDVEAAQQTLPPQAQKLLLEQIYPMLLERLVDSH